MRSLNTSWVIISLLMCVEIAQGQSRTDIRPDFAVFQHAGSIGFASAGFGYDVSKGRARLSFHYGHVPRNQGGTLNIFTGKLLCVPWIFQPNERFTINPLDAGVIVSYHTGDNFKSNVPDYFSKNYYWWHTNLRFHLATEHSVTCHFNEGSPFSRLTTYLEFNINDLYLVSYFTNTSSLRLHELVKGGIGVRLAF